MSNSYIYINKFSWFNQARGMWLPFWINNCIIQSLRFIIKLNHSIKPAMYVARRYTMVLLWLCLELFVWAKIDDIGDVLSKMLLTMWTSCLLRCVISLKIQMNVLKDHTVLPYKSPGIVCSELRVMLLFSHLQFVPGLYKFISALNT